MRTTKRNLLTAASVAVTGLMVTGGVVTVAQEPAKVERRTGPGPSGTSEEMFTAFPDIKPLFLAVGDGDEPEQLRRFRTVYGTEARVISAKKLGETYAQRMPQGKETDPPLRKLLIAKLRVTTREWNSLVESFESGDPSEPYELTRERVYLAEHTLIETAAELSARPEDLKALLEFGVGRAKALEAFASYRLKRGTGQELFVARAQRHRLDAEIALLKHVEQAGGKAK
jgi:hypothetical protein